MVSSWRYGRLRADEQCNQTRSPKERPRSGSSQRRGDSCIASLSPANAFTGLVGRSSEPVPGRELRAWADVSISHLIYADGYWVVFLLVGVESLGIPLPGETAVIVAGAYAGRTHHLSPWVIFAVASASAIIGDNVGFWIGDKGGYRLARRFGSRFHLDDRKLKIGRYAFDTHGTKVVFFGRFVSILRTYAAFLAGANQMRWRRFLPANASGGVTWAGIYTFASYLGGNTLTRLSGTISLVVVGVVILALVALLLLLRGEIDKIALRAEAAYPGPLK